jgi:hypothetical protein
MGQTIAKQTERDICLQQTPKRIWSDQVYIISIIFLENINK